MRFTTSDRRKFERDVYDFGRSLGLSKGQARDELRKARAFCGEEDYHSDNSAWEDEVDDSLITLDKFSNLLVSASASVEPLPQAGIVAPKEPDLLLIEQNASSVPNVTQGTNEEDQEIATGTETTAPKASSALMTLTGIDKGRKRNLGETDLVPVNVNGHVEKKIRQDGVTEIGNENAKQTVQPTNIDKDQKRHVRKDKKKRKRRRRSTNIQTGSVSLQKLDSAERSPADPNDKGQNLKSENLQRNTSDTADGVKMRVKAVGKKRDKSTLCQRSEQTSNEKENRDISHKGFPSPMI